MIGLNSWGCQLYSWGDELESGLGDISSAGVGQCEIGSKHLLRFERNLSEWQEMLERYHVGACAIFEFGHFANWDRRREIYFHHDRLARLMSRVQITRVVLGPGLRFGSADHTEHWRNVLTMLREIAKRYDHHGIESGIHPHYGQCIFTEEEIEFVMTNTEENIRLVPDTEHITKANIAFMDLLERYDKRIMSLHLKNPLSAQDTYADIRRYVYDRQHKKGFVTLEFDRSLMTPQTLPLTVAHLQEWLMPH